MGLSAFDVVLLDDSLGSCFFVAALVFDHMATVVRHSSLF